MKDIVNVCSRLCTLLLGRQWTVLVMANRCLPVHQAVKTAADVTTCFACPTNTRAFMQAQALPRCTLHQCF
jgi:hypothetical protein